MEEENKLKKGDNPKGQGPCKPKKIKTKEEKEAQRAKQAINIIRSIVIKTIPIKNISNKVERTTKNSRCMNSPYTTILQRIIIT